MEEIKIKKKKHEQCFIISSSVHSYIFIHSHTNGIEIIMLDAMFQSTQTPVLDEENMRRTCQSANNMNVVFQKH